MKHIDEKKFNKINDKITSESILSYNRPFINFRFELFHKLASKERLNKLATGI